MSNDFQQILTYKLREFSLLARELYCESTRKCSTAQDVLSFLCAIILGSSKLWKALQQSEMFL